MENSSQNETTPVNVTDKVGSAIKYSLISGYTIVFLTALVGNIIIILSVYKFKEVRTVVNIFLVNLAIADLLFVALSTFDCIEFLYGEWIFGDVVCPIQGTLIELSYTVSVCTLTVVAFERYVSICYPHKPKRTFQQAVKVCGLVWIFGVLFCSCLLYGYSVMPDEQNRIQCSNATWGKNSRLSFYVIHTIFVYLLPLTILLYSHAKISGALPNIKVTTLNSDNSKQIDTKNRQESVDRRKKIVRLLTVVTTVFFVLWTPFIVVRLLLYVDVAVNEMLWTVTQLIIFSNTAVNCFIYALMSQQFRTAFKGLFMCQRRLQEGHIQRNVKIGMKTSEL